MGHGSGFKLIILLFILIFVSGGTFGANIQLRHYIAVLNSFYYLPETILFKVSTHVFDFCD